jgi:Kelch motif
MEPHAVPQNPPHPPTPLCTASLYDPRTNSWSATGTMSIGRFGHTATLLASGKVLVAGGTSSCNDSGCDHTGALDLHINDTATAELYDPRTGHWSPTGSMHAARSSHTAIRLADGRVLVLQPGARPDAELYDPRTGRWRVTHGMTMFRSGYYSEILLPDGRVLVAGGRDADGLPTASSELYDPRTGRWSATGSMFHARAGHTATLLPNGLVLVAGGC